MKKTVTHFRRPRFALALAVACLLAGGAGAFAKSGGAGLLRAASAARPEINVALAGTVARGDSQIALDKAEAVRPGEILTWTITSANSGDGAAHGYGTVGQIPAGTTFVLGSAAAAGTTVTYSIDNGENFSAQPTIEERQTDGTTKRVAAPASMYTQVRYEWVDPLAPAAKLIASYKVRVR